MNEIKTQDEKQKFQISGIFPVPIYHEPFDREITQKELNYFEKIREKDFKNIGNVTSDDNYILNNKELKNLKEDLNTSIKKYFDNVICPANNIIPYITQSWLNWTKPGQYHHKHYHANSIISGVLYINADEKNDSIEFYSEKRDPIEIYTEKLNIFNTKAANFIVKTGLLVLFPSWLDHAVNVKNGDNTRVSLAFNTFIRGSIGHNRSLTELKL